MVNESSKVIKLANTLSANSITYVESGDTSYTFTNVKDGTNYKIYAYAVDTKNVKTYTYDYKYSSNGDLPVIRSVSFTNDKTSIIIASVTTLTDASNISKYYFSIDNGRNYIESSSSSYTFSNLAYGYYNVRIYVEDVNGERSNIYVKRYNFVPLPEPEKEIYAERGTISTMDGEVIEVNDVDSMKNYLIINGSAIEGENLSDYYLLGVVDVTFVNIVDTDVILHVPGCKSGDTVTVKKYNNGSWSSLDTTVIGDDQVKVKFTESDTYEILKKKS